MAKKSQKKNPRTVNQQIASLDKVVRAGFQQTDRRFRQIDDRLKQHDDSFSRIDRRFDAVDFEIASFRKEVSDRFELVEERINGLANHVDSFMKLHETLDIEFKVLKEQINRLDERLKRIEAAQPS
jgi:archaellum component FlaC